MTTGAASNYLELKLLDEVLSGVAYASPTGLTCHLYTAAPSDAGGGTEVSGGTYAAQNCTASFAPASGGSVTNDVLIDFGTATANWGTVTHFAIKDQLSNYLVWGALDSSKTVTSGDTFDFEVGELTISLD